VNGLELAERALAAAKGGEGVVATVVSERSLMLRYARSRPTQATAIDDLTVEIAVLVGGRVGRASTNATDADSLAACAREFLPSRQPPCPAARDRVLFLLVALAIGVPGIFLVLHFLRLVTHIWYYQALVAVLATCADGAFAVRGEASRPATGARLALAACAIVLGAHATWNSRAFRMTNADVIAARLDEQAVPADLIVVTPYQMSASFERYYRGLAPWITLPEVPDHHFQDPSAFKEKMSRRDPIRTELDRIAATLRGGHRVWMVGSLKFPNAEATLPHLPPAPAPETGWLDVPYINAWSAEAGAVVAREARTIRVVAPRSAGLVNRFENTRLLVAEP